MLQTEKKFIIHILSKTLGCKGNKAVIFGKLREYNSLKFYTAFFIACPNHGSPKTIEFYGTGHLLLFFISYKTFLKTKRGLELISLLHFRMIFEEEYS